MCRNAALMLLVCGFTSYLINKFKSRSAVNSVHTQHAIEKPKRTLEGSMKKLTTTMMMTNTEILSQQKNTMSKLDRIERHIIDHNNRKSQLPTTTSSSTTSKSAALQTHVETLTEQLQESREGVEALKKVSNSDPNANLYHNPESSSNPNPSAHPKGSGCKGRYHPSSTQNRQPITT